MAKSRFTSPVMRFVQGSVDEAQTKDAQGNPRLVKTGPNAGQPNPQFFVAGAIAKNDPAWPPFWAALVNQAVADAPAMFPHGAAPLIAHGGPSNLPAGVCLHPLFSFKIADGDGLDQNGKQNNAKEGFAGHWVVRFGSAYPPRCFHAGRYAAHEQIQEKNVIRRGYFIRVNGTIEYNGNQQRPGLYVNLDMVELAGYGPEIVSGPDAEAAFGGAPVTLPAGASAMPVAPAPAAAPPAPAYVAPVPAAAPPPAAPVQPYAGYMGNAAPVAVAPTLPVVAPPPPSAPVATPSPTSGPTMTAAAQGATYAQMIAAGWTDETLRSNGMMV